MSLCAGSDSKLGVVHAKATGAWGEFECTRDISDFTSVAFLRKVSEKTKALARLTTAAGEKGSSDTARDICGFALKMFTKEGNWNFVGNDLPVFFIRNAVKFSSLNRSHKHHPQTNVPDSTMFWDFHNNNQEGVHCLMQLFGGCDTSKIHFKPDSGIQNLDSNEAVQLAGEEPDYHIQDLYNAIERGDHPLVMDPKEAETYHWNIFDITHIWPQKGNPPRPIGRLTLNRNPVNRFQGSEQAAFSPSTMIPGIGSSADPMLQARMFSYPDAARYRCRAIVLSTSIRLTREMGQCGWMSVPPSVPSVLVQQTLPTMRVGGQSHLVFSSEATDEDFEQPRDLWEIFKNNSEDEIFAKNVAAHVGKALPQVQKVTIEMFSRADKEVEEAIQKALEVLDSKRWRGHRA
ncbi:catalase-like domain-containing protein [Triangularia setosa]|uniref:Catalase-like domain-containing protein n=1 Tax=Triangularia setosa TaxID=2587417 RepID=A0AAN7A7S9_9PEZI|nr:catalase-like domain-containing protein [Podospora setosa]